MSPVIHCALAAFLPMVTKLLLESTTQILFTRQQKMDYVNLNDMAAVAQCVSPNQMTQNPPEIHNPLRMSTASVVAS